MTEQELILTSVLQCRRIDLYTEMPAVSPEQQQQLDMIAERRAHHEPVQYIFNNAEFMGLDFYVDQNVLIPRPETELLVATVEEFLRSSQEPLRVLDIGTGSGNIIISLAKNFPHHRFFSVDVSGPALDVARKNAIAHQVLSRIQFIQGNIFSRNEFIGQLEKFDIIVSNPPYIPSAEILQLQPEVLKEPLTALDGGEDGLSFYRAIAQFAPSALAAQGVLVLEIGQGQRESIQRIFEHNKDFMVKECISDYSQIERIMAIQRT